MKFLVLLALIVAVSAAPDHHSSNIVQKVVPKTTAAPKCPTNEVYSTCKDCDLTCAQQTPGVCIAVCTAGCKCNVGYVRNTAGSCVLPKSCPKPTKG